MSGKVLKKNENKNKKSRWTNQQIELLIEIWADKISDLRGARRNSHIFKEMQVELALHKCDVSQEDIKVRIHNLTSKYRKEKSKIGPSGGSPSEWPFYHKIHAILGSFAINNVSSLVEDSITETDTDFTEEAEVPEFSVEFLDEEMFEERAHEQSASSQLSTLSSGPSRAYEESSSSQISTASSPESSPTASGSGTRGAGKRAKQTNFQNELLKRWDLLDYDMKQQEERIKQTDEKMLNLELRRTELLEKFVNDTAELKDAFINFLTTNANTARNMNIDS